MLFLSVYTFISVGKYFGFSRSSGEDHFYPQKFKNVPFVKQGIYKYCSNSMYAFLLLMPINFGILS